MEGFHATREHIQGQWTRQESPPTVAAEDLTSGSLLTCGLCTSVLPILRTLANTLPRSTAKSVVVAVCNQLDLAPEAKREEICLKIVDSYAVGFACFSIMEQYFLKYIVKKIMISEKFSGSFNFFSFV